MAGTVTIDTSSIQGTSGYLDFQFSGPSTPAAILTTSGLNLHGGSVGVEMITGDASGSLLTQLMLLNTLNSPPNEDFASVTFGTQLTFGFDFSGPAVTNPDGVSDASTFAFSILDATGMNPLLLVSNWASVDPGGFAFLVDLNNQGGAIATNFLAHGVVNPEGVAVPEPSAGSCLAIGLGMLASVRLMRRLRKA